MKQAINTRTQEEYDALMRYYESKGIKTIGGLSPIEMNAFHVYIRNTCFDSDGEAVCFADANYYMDNGYEIIPFTEFAKANIEPDYKALYLEGREVIKELSFAGQITGGTAGKDDNLCRAIEKAEAYLTKHKDLTPPGE